METAGNVADLVRNAAALDPDHPALVEAATERRLTWGELDAAVDVAATGFVEAGLEPGDRVVVRLPGTVEYCIAIFATLRAGGVLVPTARRAAPRELDEVLTSSKATLLVAGADDEAAARAAGHNGAKLLEPPAATPPRSGWLRGLGGRGGRGAASEQVAARAGGDDLAMLAFTSAFAGTGRAVMLPHRALLANVAQCAALRPALVTPADRVLLALPLFHIYGFGPGLLQVANAGATAVLAGRFNAEESLAVISRHRVTAVVAVPPMYQAWLQLGTDTLRAGFGTVRLLTSGAAPLQPSVTEAFERAAGLGIFEGYGLTETGPVVTTTLVGGSPKPGSVGRPLPGGPDVPGVQLRLVHPDGTPLGTPLGDDEDDDSAGTGLVSVRGPSLFTGYWPDGDGGPDADGWFRTTDVGYLDTDGDLFLVDRASDLIIVNGFNVYPHEVERALLEHPAIAEAAVIGIPHETTGEAVRAVLVLTDGAKLTFAELTEHCTPRLARYKMPTSVELVDKLPVTATGKLARRTLRTLSGHPLS